LVSAGQIAVLIAAGFFALGVSAAVFVLARLARLISEASRMLAEHNDRAAALIARAQAAVDRTHEQLARTDSITASMDEVTANMAELSGHVSALACLARGISAGLGAPLLRVSALAFGVRRAVSLRLAPGVAAPATRGLLPSPQAGVPARQDTPAAGRRDALPAGRRDALPAGRGAPVRRIGLRGGMPRQRSRSGAAGREEARR
jgi:Bacterial protein of unknown function (DUF948)